MSNITIQDVCESKGISALMSVKETSVVVFLCSSMAECLLDKACVEISTKKWHFAECRFKQMGNNKAFIQPSNITVLRAFHTEGCDHLSPIYFK